MRNLTAALILGAWSYSLGASISSPKQESFFTNTAPEINYYLPHPSLSQVLTDFHQMSNLGNMMRFVGAYESAVKQLSALMLEFIVWSNITRSVATFYLERPDNPIRDNLWDYFSRIWKGVSHALEGNFVDKLSFAIWQPLEVEGVQVTDFLNEINIRVQRLLSEVCNQEVAVCLSDLKTLAGQLNENSFGRSLAPWSLVLATFFQRASIRMRMGGAFDDIVNMVATRISNKISEEKASKLLIDFRKIKPATENPFIDVQIMLVNARLN